MKKKILFVILIPWIMFNCSKEIYDSTLVNEKSNKKLIIEDPRNPFDGLPDSSTFIIISTSVIDINDSNNEILKSESSTIVLWPKTKDEKISIKNAKEALNGIAYDNLNQQIKTDLIFNNSNIYLQGIKSGSYLIAIILNDKVSQGKNSYSFKEIELKENGKMYMHKVFNLERSDNNFSPWTSNIIIK